MSLCAKYIKNPTDCQLPEQEVEKLNQYIFNEYNNVTKNFSLSPDNTYYKNNSNCCKDTNCWSISDPRLYDQVRGFNVCLDSPPLSLNIDKNLRNLNYPQKPQTYGKLEDINLGDVKYYYNTDVHQPFSTVNFTIPTEVNKKMFVDPMTSVKPEYSRTKLIYGIGCDQETRDQLAFREDMIERLLRKQNQRLF